VANPYPERPVLGATYGAPGQAGTKPDIAAELSGINDPDTAGRRSPRASLCRDALLDVVADHPDAEARFLDWLSGDIDVHAAELAEAMIARAAR
jgi:hypothetical protein